MKISIITACYNNKETIEDTLHSVASQSYDQIEHIIIDGMSSDGTLDIIEQNKSKVTKIVSEKDTGIYDALNKGILLAEGEVIGFLHADDIYADETVITAVAEQFQKNDTDSVYGDLHYVSKHNTNKIIRYWISGNYQPKKIKRGWMPPHPTFFVKKRIYDQYGLFDTNLRIAADYDIILRFLGKHKISTSYLSKTLIKMRMGGESNKNLKNILQKMKDDVKALKKNNLGNWHTVFLKNIIKIPQLFKINS
jgi:glycosyltransferase involved in cell wall biosynthesis